MGLSEYWVLKSTGQKPQTVSHVQKQHQNDVYKIERKQYCIYIYIFIYIYIKSTKDVPWSSGRGRDGLGHRGTPGGAQRISRDSEASAGGSDETRVIFFPVGLEIMEKSSVDIIHTCW